MSVMIVVSNSSPIINLAAVDELELLHQLYGRVIIPQLELLHKL